MNLPNFWYGSCSDGSLSENHTLYAGKILIWRNLVHLRPFFGQNWLFLEFLTYNFQTQTWIFLIFGMELLWIMTLSGEPIILCLVIGAFIALCFNVHIIYHCSCLSLLSLIKFEHSVHRRIIKRVNPILAKILKRLPEIIVKGNFHLRLVI